MADFKATHSQKILKEAIWPQPPRTMNNKILCLRTFFYYTPLHLPINRVSVGPESNMRPFPIYGYCYCKSRLHGYKSQSKLLCLQKQIVDLFLGFISKGYIKLLFYLSRDHLFILQVALKSH